ncbi:MAG TPA: TetR/AcrR family transcriptional regulator [Bradyrhizobium sp.]|nr:TetR/AcrR family transcriptional regulator [Bradyrhizobium sp.]
MAARPASKQRAEGSDETPARQRILDAAFSAFMERGFAATSTLEIATRARVSKRELYALVGSKQEMLAACIAERAKRLQLPADLPEPHDQETLAHILEAFGARMLHEISDPTVIAVFRLAIAEAVHAPEVAQALNAIGVDPSRTALREIMSRARSAGLLGGEANEMAEHFVGLLWGNLMSGLLLQTAERPSAREIARRAGSATAALLRLYARQEEP